MTTHSTRGVGMKDFVAPEAAVRQVEPEESSAGTTRLRDLPRWWGLVLTGLMAAYALYFVYGGAVRPLPGIQHRAIHLGLGIAFIFLLAPPVRRLRKARWGLGLDVVLALFFLGSAYYVYQSFQSFGDRVGLPATSTDVLIGSAFLVLMFEAARRMTGLAFPIVTLAFFAYAFFGSYLPPPFQHIGYDVNGFISTFFLTLNGPFGQITQISANYIVIFVVFASFMTHAGTGGFIRELAESLVGRFRGGPGKVAVVASSGMGMLTGSSLANVASVGSVTIPMMKRTGYRAEFAGGVEATSGMGSQIMPPIMGGTIFVMMEVLGKGYWDIASSAILLGILFYISVFFMVDFEAARTGLKGSPPDAIPRTRDVLKRGWYYLVPIITLVYALAVVGASPARSAFYGIASCVVLIFATRRPKKALRDVINSLAGGTKNSLVIISIVGLASTISGIVTVTGLGVHLSTILLEIAGNNVLILLIVTAVASIVLGMGVPVLVAYVMLSVLVAPGLIDAGVSPLAAHMFIFYFGVLSAITPPVAPDAIVASGIAGSSPFRTAVEAMRIGGPIYVLPFMFVYDDVLLLQGPWPQVLIAGVTAALGVYAIACAWQGIALPGQRIGRPSRLVLLAAGLLLVAPSEVSSAVGLALLAVVSVISWRRKEATALSSPISRER